MTELLRINGNRDIRGPLRTTPLEWDASTDHPTKQVRVVDDPRSQRIFKFKSVIAVGTLVLLILQAANRLFQSNENDKNGKSGSENVLACLFITLAILLNGHMQMCSWKASEIAMLMNGLIRFDLLYPKPLQNFMERPILGKLSLCMAFTALLSQTCIPFGLVFGLHWQFPHRASLVGYWLIPRENSLNPGLLKEIVPISVKVLVLLFNFWFWVLIITAAVFVVGVIHSLCALSLLDDINDFEQLCKKNAPGEKFIYGRANMWRHIQLLTGLFNVVQRELIVMITCAVMFIFSCSFTSLVRGGSSGGGLAYLATLILLVTDCLLMLLADLGGMAAMYEKSVMILKKMHRPRNQGGSVKLQRWEQKFYQSCPPLKVMFGSNNYVDALMPLNSLQFAVSLIANFLLMTG